MHYSEVDLDNRRQWLKDMFFFDCSCHACIQKWPVYEELSEKVEDEQLMQSLQQIEKSIRLALSRGDVDTAIALHAKDVGLMEKGLKEPHRLFVSVRNSLQFCFWKKFGSY